MTTLLYMLVGFISPYGLGGDEPPEDETPDAPDIPQPTADAGDFPLSGAVETMLDVLTWLGFAAAIGGVVVGGGILAVAHVTSNSMWGSKGKSMALLALLGGLVVGSASQLVQWAASL